MTMMNNFHFGFQPLNFTNGYYSTANSFLGDAVVLCVFSILFTCIFGLVGHGIFLWLLTCSIKKNAFATYLLNLSSASFGILFVIFTKNIIDFLSFINVDNLIFFYVHEILFHVFLPMYTSRQFILAAISIDRCVSVLFPNWYRNHKSPNYPTFVCFFLWASSFLIFGIQLTLLVTNGYFNYFNILLLHWLYGSFFICFLVVTTTTLTLFIKVCFKSQLQRRGTLITAILLSLLLSLLVDVLWLLICFHRNIDNQSLYFLLGRSLESSVNPLIYYLVGRRKGSRLQERMSVILQGVFKEEEPPFPNQTQPQHLQRTSRF